MVAGLAQVFDPCLEEVGDGRLKVMASGASFAGRDGGLGAGAQLIAALPKLSAPSAWGRAAAGDE